MTFIKIKKTKEKFKGVPKGYYRAHDKIDEGFI